LREHVDLAWHSIIRSGRRQRIQPDHCPAISPGPNDPQLPPVSDVLRCPGTDRVDRTHPLVTSDQVLPDARYCCHPRIHQPEPPAGFLGLLR
ncbi:hypothetical protein TNIN_78111, partial [Trichonephila inaurata madagascariensis]